MAEKNEAVIKWSMVEAKVLGLTNERDEAVAKVCRPVAGKSPWGGPGPPNSPKSPLFVRVPPYLHTKIFPMGGAMAPLAPPSATGLKVCASKYGPRF